MKPLEIAFLLLAGAVCGAIVTSVWLRPQLSAGPAVVVRGPPSAPVGTPASAPPPAAEPAAAAEPVRVPTPVTTTELPAHPPRFPERKKAARPRPFDRRQRAGKLQPVVVAKVEPARLGSPHAVMATAEAPQSPASLPGSPAPTEPGNATLSRPQSATPQPEPPHVVTLNTGLLIRVRLVAWLSSERTMPGEAFVAALDKELVVDGFVIAERGARVEGRVVAVNRGVGVQGLATLVVELTRLFTSDGQRVAIQTDNFERRSEPTQRKEDAEKAATLPLDTHLVFRLRASVTLTEKRS